MTEYLITDLMTLKNTWIAAPTVTAALIQHENAKRLSNGGVTLSEKSRASHYSQGNVIDASLATSACRGLRTNVVRD